ncbi:MAG: mechanosensitive ion channel family protein [Bacteroidota bacterium]
MKKILLLSLMAALSPILLSGQDAPTPSFVNPYNTAFVHLYYLQDETFEPEIAARALNVKADSSTTSQLAIQLKQIYDGLGLYVQLNNIPEDPNFIDSSSQKAIYVPFPKELPEVYIEKVGNKWLYAQQTIDQIPALHKRVFPLGADLLLNLLPRFGHEKVFGLAVWQYVGLGILLGILLIVQLILSRLLIPLVRRASQSRLVPNLIEPKVIVRLSRLLSIFILIQFFKLALPMLQLPIHIGPYVMTGLKIASSIIFMLAALTIVDIVVAYARRFTSSTASKMDDQLLPIIRKGIQAVIVIGVLIQILRLLDFNVTALIAGVSIGGLALALAAQDTVKNLIGSAMIFVDRPFQIGDYIISGDFEGSVVQVGFRTTRIQTVDSSIIAVPNGTVANAAIRNLGIRTFRLYNTTLGVTYDTTADQIEAFMEGLRAIIQEHPNVMEEGHIVKFSQFADSSLNIMFRARILVETYDEELQTKEDLNLSILRLATDMGIDFAFPSTSVYIEKNG